VAKIKACFYCNTVKNPEYNQVLDLSEMAFLAPMAIFDSMEREELMGNWVVESKSK